MNPVFIVFRESQTLKHKEEFILRQLLLLYCPKPMNLMWKSKSLTSEKTPIVPLDPAVNLSIPPILLFD